MQTTKMFLLTLNCQKGYQSGLKNFLIDKLDKEFYDVLLLQEVTDQVSAYLNHSSYECIRVTNSLLCIVYKKSLKLVSQGFKSFTGGQHPCFGILWTDLEMNNNRVRFVSIHAHSGIGAEVRTKEVELAKEILKKEVAMPTIITGDFNAGFFNEPAKIAHVFKPEFVWATEKLGPTLDSRYCENVPHLTNRIAAFLSFFNIGIKLRTDHIFIDQKMAEKYKITCKILPGRVSDHSPIEGSLVI